MKTTRRILPLILLLAISQLPLAPHAFAIDQVTTTSGELIEGTILSNVPHQHVDIELVNGTKRRIPADQVSNVERDVPSNNDRKMVGADSLGYFGLLAGFSVNTTTSQAISFTAGARAGFNFAQLDFAKLAFGLEYTYNKDTSSYYNPASFTSGSMTSNEILLQLLFRKVGNSGFYFGGEAGLAIDSENITNTVFGSVTTSGTGFEFGGLIGFDFFLSQGFSVGVEAKEDYQLSTSSGYIHPALAMTRVLVSGTFHF